MSLKYPFNKRMPRSDKVRADESKNGYSEENNQYVVYKWNLERASFAHFSHVMVNFCKQIGTYSTYYSDKHRNPKMSKRKNLVNLEIEKRSVYVKYRREKFRGYGTADHRGCRNYKYSRRESAMRLLHSEYNTGQRCSRSYRKSRASAARHIISFPSSVTLAEKT